MYLHTFRYGSDSQKFLKYVDTYQQIVYFKTFSIISEICWFWEKYMYEIQNRLKC